MSVKDKEKRSSICIPGDTANKLNEIGEFRKSNKVFGSTQPLIIIDLVDKEYKRINKLWL